ncbi:hypothetical protein ACN47E_006547 [Coniothyrium glycines]
MTKTLHKLPIRETISYPRIKVTPNNDSCQNPSMSFEHVLACGHLVTTAQPDEPCARNCHHIDARIKDRERVECSTREFFCNACIESDMEALIPKRISSTEAEAMRTNLRRVKAKARKKSKNYRRCYIAHKVVSVLCRDSGSAVRRYKPRAAHHPFDTTIPQIGDNMWQDIVVGSPGEEDGEEDVVELGDEGADYVRYARHFDGEEQGA